MVAKVLAHFQIAAANIFPGRRDPRVAGNQFDFVDARPITSPIFSHDPHNRGGATMITGVILRAQRRAPYRRLHRGAAAACGRAAADRHREHGPHGRVGPAARRSLPVASQRAEFRRRQEHRDSRGALRLALVRRCRRTDSAPHRRAGQRADSHPGARIRGDQHSVHVALLRPVDAALRLVARLHGVSGAEAGAFRVRPHPAQRSLVAGPGTTFSARSGAGGAALQLPRPGALRHQVQPLHQHRGTPAERARREVRLAAGGAHDGARPVGALRAEPAPGSMARSAGFSLGWLVNIAGCRTAS